MTFEEEQKRETGQKEKAEEMKEMEEMKEKKRLADQEGQRAEVEGRRDAEERRPPHEEKQKADEDRQRADDERPRAEEEKKRADAERIREEQELNKAEEERAKAEEDKDPACAATEQAEPASAAAAQDAEHARAAQDETEKKLRAGIRPVVWPTVEEIRAHRTQLHYLPGRLHFAVAGIAGSGKSSLVNALRGITNTHPNAACVDVTETTLVISRYEDPNANRPFVWYDIPGAGTLSVPDWEYFNDFGLYVFDAIIVLFDNRFTETDVALLRNAARFQIPTYIVRSKSMQHISNLLSDLPFRDDEDDASRLATARQRYIQRTRDSVAKNLSAAGLPEQRAYLIEAKEVLCEIVQGLSPNGVIDEVDFLTDILEEARARRLRAKPAQQPARSGLLGTSLFKNW